MTPYFGDYAAGETINFMWHSFNSSGASVTRATNGTISVYKDNSTTQTTTGVTDTEDFDSLTGVHHVAIATTDSFYTAGTDYIVVLSGATIDGQTVNAVIGHFSIENRTPVALGTGPYPNLGILDRGTAQAAGATSIQLRSAATFGDDTIIGATVAAYGSTQGYWQTRVITDYVSSTDTATVDAWQVTPSGTVTYILFASAPGSTSVPIPADIRQVNGGAIPTPVATGVPSVNVSYAAGVGPLQEGGTGNQGIGE